MDTRKKIIIVSIVAGALVFLTASFLINKKSNSSTNTAPEESSVVADSNMEKGNTGSSADVIEQNTQGGGAPVDINSNINTADNKDTQQDFSADDIKFTSPKNDQGEELSLEQFSEINHMKVGKFINNLLDGGGFYLLSCPSASVKKNAGMIFTLKSIPDYKGNIYADEVNYMKSWEKTMFGDVKAVLFPDMNFTSQQLQQVKIFKDGKYRYAETLLKSNEWVSINYTFVNSYIVISNSMQCIDSAQAQLLKGD